LKAGQNQRRRNKARAEQQEAEIATILQLKIEEDARHVGENHGAVS
jgi:hypothetical protein